MSKLGMEVFYMNRKPTFAENLRQFVEGKGFYVAVLVCVAAIGISGFYLMNSMGAPEEPDAPVSGTASVTVTPSPSSVLPSPSVSPSQPQTSQPPTLAASPSPSASASPSPAPSASASPAPAQSPAAQESAKPSRPAALVYTWPVKGEVLADFSLETLAYDETMLDWRTHSGIDIAAAAGTTVMAAADGTVSLVYDDDLMGTTVIIDHGQGMVSTYANLQAKPAVKEGDTVYTGSVIGAVGTTAIAESGRPGHLHFEMAKEGIAVDPELYLPEKR